MVVLLLSTAAMMIVVLILNVQLAYVLGAFVHLIVCGARWGEREGRENNGQSIYDHINNNHNEEKMVSSHWNNSLCAVIVVVGSTTTKHPPPTLCHSCHLVKIRLSKSVEVSQAKPVQVSARAPRNACNKNKKKKKQQMNIDSIDHSFNLEALHWKQHTHKKKGEGKPVSQRAEFKATVWKQ